MPWPPIPSWQSADLQTLAAQGRLSGVSPLILGVIDQEESGGRGGGINSSGYGGFFGLGAGSKYPGGTATAQLLQGTDPSSFDQQATIAASAFAAYQQQQGGDPIKAEEVYQSGRAGTPTPGSKLLAGYLGAPGSSPPPAPTPAQLQGLNLNPGDLFGIPGTAGSAAAGALGGIFSGLSGLFVRGGLILFGGVLIIVALVIAARGGINAASGAASASRQQREQTRAQVRTIREEGQTYRAGAQRATRRGVVEDAGEAAAAA